MRWIGGFVLGILAGALVGLGLLYANPFTGEELPSVESTSLLRYELGPETLSLTHGDQLGFDLQPSDISALWESTIRRTMLGTFVLRDLRGDVVGIASRATKISPQSNPLIRGILTSDHWLVTVPGAGSYFIESNDNIWPLLRDTFVKVNLLGRSWSGTRHFELTSGPDPNGAAVLTGASGRFAGVSGSAVHSVDIERYARASQLQYPVTGQLRLEVRRPAQQAATAP